MKKGTHPKYKKRRYWRKPHCKAGNNNPNGKIGHTIAKAIREQYIPYKVTAVYLAERYGLSVGNVRCIIKGVLWGGPLKSGQHRNLTQEQAEDLRQKRSEGWSYRQLEKHFPPISRGSIHNLLAGRTYNGRLAERSIAPVLKTGRLKSPGGSNPPPTDF